MDKVLITGGLGFIGSYLCKYFIAQNINVIIVDNMSTNIKTKDDFISDSVEFLDLDLAKLDAKDAELLENAISTSDLIYHLAGSVGVKYIDDNPKMTIQNNYYMSANIFPLFEKYNKKVIFGSTSEVYGNSDNAKESDILKIGSPDILRWGYSCNKLMSEFLLSSFNFPYIIVRFFNVTGKGQIGDHGMVLPRFIHACKKKQDLIVIGDGFQERSFCDIRDAINLLILIGSDSEFDNQIFNVGNEANATTIISLAEKVIEKSKSSGQVKYEEFSEVYSKNSKDIITRTPNTGKTQQFYKCKYTLDDIIQSMLE